MKTLYIVRHAKSSWEHPDLNDFDRPLNKRGEEDAPRMGKRLKERAVKPDLICSSPANRAITTAKTIGEILGYSLKMIRSERRLYHADEDELLDIVKSASDQHDSVMIVGHNPGLTEFANNLLGEKIDNIPTSGVVAAQLKIESWKDTHWNCGKLIFFDFPKNDKP